jgi:very-short-patch-repair endonuclease
VAEGSAPTRSDLEDAGLEFLARQQLGRPLVNAIVEGLEVDYYFPKAGLVIELDSDRYHSTRLRRQVDARKQAILEAAGHRVLRIDEHQIEGPTQAQTAQRVRHALD